MTGKAGRWRESAAGEGRAADSPEERETPARPTERNKGQALTWPPGQLWPQRHRVHLLEARKKVLDQR